MAFVYEPAPIVVTFDTPGAEGLELRSRPISIDTLMKVETLGDEMTREGLVDSVSMMVDHLSGWNIETADGESVPVSAQWVLGTDARFLLVMLRGWIDAVSGRLSQDLGKDSTTGPGVEVLELLPMVVSSPSP